MACTIDATVGGAAANSYCTIAEGTAYHETHPYATVWEDAGDDERCRALQTATRLLDQWYEWTGVAVGSTQALLWPRIDVIGPNGYLEASDAIPTRLRDATAELARQLLAGDRTADSDIETQGLKSLKAGSVELAFSGAAVGKVIPDAVAGFVSVYGRLRGRSGADVTLRRG